MLFSDMGLSEPTLKGLAVKNFINPTPIQEQAIPQVLEGKDIIGLANTGTGKTLAFGIPILEKLQKKDNNVTLILVPTRELANQVFNALKDILIASGIREYIALLIGGEPYAKQYAQLKSKPKIIVGTPGRVIDHFTQLKQDFAKKAKGKTQGFSDKKSHGPNYDLLSLIDLLVLDEADRMLDLGFGVQIDEIIDMLPSRSQTLMFSATMEKSVQNLTNKYLNNPTKIQVDSPITANKKVVQEMLEVREHDKFDLLVSELNKREGSVLIFVKRRDLADEMATDLCALGFAAAAIHGDLRQQKRDRILHGFRTGKYRILVATDVAARGIDVPHLQHVINYDLPQAPEDYIHRIGRTGRGGAEGCALSLVSGQDLRKWAEIQRLMFPEKNIKLPPKDGGKPRNRRGNSNSRFVKENRGADRFSGEKRPRRDDRDSRDSRDGGFSGEKRARRDDRDNRDGGSRDNRGNRDSRDSRDSRGGRDNSERRNFGEKNKKIV